MAENMNNNRSNQYVNNGKWNDNSARENRNADNEQNEYTSSYDEGMNNDNWRDNTANRGYRNNNVQDNQGRNNQNENMGSSYGDGRGQQGSWHANGMQYTGDHAQYGGTQYGGRGYENSAGSRGQFSQGGYYGSGSNYSRDEQAKWGRQNNSSDQRNNDNRNRNYDMNHDGNYNWDNNSPRNQQNGNNNYGNNGQGQYGSNRGMDYNSYGQGSNSGYSRDSSYGSNSSEGQYKGIGPKGYQRSEDRIKEDVHDRLTDDPHIDASNIEVSVQKNEVKLTGTVDSRQAKRHAEDLVESISGVANVENLIKVNDKRNSEVTGTTNMSNNDKTKR